MTSHPDPCPWEVRYRAGHTGWDRGAVSPALNHWLDRGALAPCRILVPGCGHGHEVVALAQAGFRVTAVDIAPTPVARLEAGLAAAGVSAEVIQVDLLQWRPALPFEAVYEQTFICALEPRQWRAYEAWLRRWLIPRGRMAALFMQTGRPGGPPHDCPVPAMAELFPTPPWDWDSDAPLRVPHPNGLEELGYLLTLGRAAAVTDR